MNELQCKIQHIGWTNCMVQCYTPNEPTTRLSKCMLSMQSCLGRVGAYCAHALKAMVGKINGMLDVGTMEMSMVRVSDIIMEWLIW